jgi:hypothetical protein
VLFFFGAHIRRTRLYPLNPGDIFPLGGSTFG